MDTRFYRGKLLPFCAVLFAITVPFCRQVAAQELTVITKNKVYQRKVQADSSFRMTELHGLMPDLVYDLRYATTNNFTKTKLYKQDAYTFLRKPVAEALKKVQEDLKQQGYGIKIFDAYRPYSATKKMWDLIRDERYVANPAKGSGHNRGISVDLTLIDLKTGKELDMGTGYDNFTDTAHHTFRHLPENILQNRQALRQAMEKEGFRALETEWWHYSFPNTKGFEVLDLDFRKLKE
jgi:D-alanyl-D-alanine dipeptidase